MVRAKHNCWLCKNEYLGRCLKNGKSIENEFDICNSYVFGGTVEKSMCIEYAEKHGLEELSDDDLDECLKICKYCKYKMDVRIHDKIPSLSGNKIVLIESASTTQIPICLFQKCDVRNTGSCESFVKDPSKHYEV